MDKDPAKSEIVLSTERIRAIGEAAMILDYIQESGLQETDSEPQNLGMYDQGDKLKACKDPRTIKAEVDGEQIPVFLPIEYHVDANQSFYKGETAYFFNWQDYQPEFEDQISNKLTEIPSGALIALERKVEDVDADDTLAKLIGKIGKQVEILPSSLDADTGAIKNVIFYYSEAHITSQEGGSFSDLSSAYEGLNTTDKWQEFTKKGVHFVSGEDIAPNIRSGKTTKLLEDLWAVYDETFNRLIIDHPSDQKIPRDFFDLLTTSPNSKVMYAEDEGKIVSALFVVENIADLPWLNQAYYKKLNKNGKTVFMPGIATRKDAKKSIIYSPRLIEAMSFLGQHIPEITGIATQCTNISSRYIPRMTDRYTQGTMNTKMTEISKYEYPVYKIL